MLNTAPQWVAVGCCILISFDYSWGSHFAAIVFTATTSLHMQKSAWLLYLLKCFLPSGYQNSAGPCGWCWCHHTLLHSGWSWCHHNCFIVDCCLPALLLPHCCHHFVLAWYGHCQHHCALTESQLSVTFWNIFPLCHFDVSTKPTWLIVFSFFQIPVV